MDTLEKNWEAIPQDAYRVSWHHFEELQAWTSSREGEYDDPRKRTLDDLRDLVHSVMSALDQVVVESIPNGAYLTLANTLKRIHEYDRDYDDDEDEDWDENAWFDEQIF